MTTSLAPRWRVLISFLLAAGSLLAVDAVAPTPADGAACFNLSVSNDNRMDYDEVDEASGLLLSRQMPGVMWTHNDDDPDASNWENNRIYAFNEAGDLLATVQFVLSDRDDTVPGPRFVELEDIAFGHGPGGDPNYIYLADTGDNNPTRPSAAIYRFPEPLFNPDPNHPVTIQVPESELEGTHFQYQSYINPAQVKPRNVEGVFVDPIAGHVYLFEKGLHAIDVNGNLADSSGLPKEYAFVYRIPKAKLFPANEGAVRLATVVSYVKGEFDATTFGITGADISADGTIVAIKNSDELFYWHRNPAESVVTTFNRDHDAPCLVNQMVKGEAVAVSPISDRIVAIREGLLSPIWQVRFTNQNHMCFGQPATLVGTGADDVIAGTDGNDVIVTYGGNDVVDGKKGNDRICLGAGNDTGDGGNGFDRIAGGEGVDTLSGGAGVDTLKGEGGRDTLRGNAGADKLYGGDLADKLLGGPHADELYGGAGKDRVLGGAGSDDLWGGRGPDTVTGGKGSDTMSGGAGSDSCDGGAGTDTAAACEDVTGVP